jgi:hypothetical protein
MRSHGAGKACVKRIRFLAFPSGVKQFSWARITFHATCVRRTVTRVTGERVLASQ